MNIIETELTVGLPVSVRILHVTDLHLLRSDGRDSDEIKALSETRKACFPHAEEAYAELTRYIEEHTPDVLAMTGDIIDFPSRANIEAIGDLVSRAGCPFLYTPGNHDWSLPKHYQSEEQYRTYMPLFRSLVGGTPDFQVLDYGGLRLIGVDNSRDRVNEEQRASFLRATEDGKPAIVFAHVPLYADTLVDDVVQVWHSPIVIGHGKSDECTKSFCAAVAEKSSAVVTGHIHFSHEDILPGSSCPQFVTALAEEGTVRLLTVR